MATKAVSIAARWRLNSQATRARRITYIAAVIAGLEKARNVRREADLQSKRYRAERGWL